MRDELRYQCRDVPQDTATGVPRAGKAYRRTITQTKPTTIKKRGGRPVAQGIDQPSGIAIVDGTDKPKPSLLTPDDRTAPPFKPGQLDTVEAELGHVAA